MTDHQRPLVMWGASGHARVLAEFLSSVGFCTVAIFDSNGAITRSPLESVPLHFGKAGFDQWIQRWGTGPLWGAVAIGGNRGGARLEIQEYMATRGVRIASLVHPRAFVAADARVGVGSQVLVNATICAAVELGEACIVNTAASVDHECIVADGVHIGPGVRLAGCVEVGRCAFVGIGATVLPRLRIGPGAIVGAGAVVTRDVPERAVAYGNPARVVKIREAKDGF